ncbi:ABC transporter substrate-binding protein [Cohnella panacarvi]|uniref:ABC transporter substrate-binding protein n=1 Tax=Cohnella panacarvi TaxID=400776 RepID=UPI00047EBB8B|nr:extracellular solute-binding protein [Cohnella panacarvi]
MLRRMKNKGKLAACLAITLAMTACMSSGKNDMVKLDPDAKGTLKIVYPNEMDFYARYGNAFKAMFPNIELEIISTSITFTNASEEEIKEKLKDSIKPPTPEEILEEQQPDVLFLSVDEYERLAKKGRLYDLDAVMKRDKFDIDSYHPPFVELLKSLGDGKLYGLSPTFTSRALFYNKNLFDQYGVPYPTDDMSWEEVLQLAARFPVHKDGDAPLYGLSLYSEYRTPLSLIASIGDAKGLSAFNEEDATFNIDTPEWKRIFQTVIDGYKSGSIALPQSDNGSNTMGLTVYSGQQMGEMIGVNPGSAKFQDGQAAMAIDEATLMDTMLQAKRMGGKIVVEDIKGSSMHISHGDGSNPGEPFDWDVVSLPVDPSMPDVAGGLRLNNLIAINASSANLSAAWEFMKLVNGEKMSKTGLSAIQGLSTRTALKKNVEGKNIDAFYAHGVNMQPKFEFSFAIFDWDFSEFVSARIRKVVDGEETLDAAIAAIQAEGRVVWNRIVNENPQ